MCRALIAITIIRTSCTTGIKEELARHPGYTWEQAAAIVDTYSARPGTSDHQTGLTVDFYPVSSRFEKTKTFRFMTENG